MGAGVCGRAYVPLALQKTKNSADKTSCSLIFSDFDLQVDWFISAFKEIRTSTNIHTLTVDIDKWVYLEGECSL